MARAGKAVTFITGAGLHKSIHNRIGANDWEWNAAKVAEEDGYSKYISSQIKQTLGGLGSFYLKRYFKEARNRLFDSKFIPDGMSMISANDERKRVISRIHTNLQDRLKNKYILLLVAEDYSQILKLESRHFRWFLRAVQWVWDEKDEEERLFCKFRGFKITQNERLSDYYDLQIESLADALLLFHKIIRDILSKTKPKENSSNIKIILESEEAKRTQDLNSELYILLFDLLLGFYATINMIAITRGETAISKTVKNILGKLNFSFRYISNIEEVITDELGDISKTIFYNSGVLKILSTSPIFLNLQKHLSQWYSGFFTGEISDVKKYIYTSRILIHYLRKTFTNSMNFISNFIQEEKNKPNQDSIISVIKEYANHIITTNYIPIESMILFDDPNQAYENRERTSLSCVRNVVYVHGHLWEEIVTAAHYTPQQLRRGKFLDFRFEQFYSPIYSDQEYKQNALTEEIFEKTLEKEDDYQDPPWKRQRSKIKSRKPSQITIKYSDTNSNHKTIYFSIPAAVPPLAYKTIPTGIFALRYNIAIQNILDSRIVIVIGFGLNPEDHFFSDILDAYLFESSQNGLKRKVVYVKYHRQNNISNPTIIDTMRFLRLRFPLFFSVVEEKENDNENGIIKVSLEQRNPPISRLHANRAELVVIWGDLREKATIEAVKREIEEGV